MKGKDTMKAAMWMLAVLLGLSPLLTAAENGKSPAILLQEALYQEETAGNLDKAIELYGQVLEQAADVERLAAPATYQLGMCHLKKGNEPAAAEYFRKAVSNYPKQTTIVKKAQAQLEKITPEETGGGLYDQATQAVWSTIGSLYGQTCAKAGMKNLYTNSNIHFVNSDFVRWSGVYGFYTNRSMEPVSGRVRLSGTTNPHQKHYDIMGNPLDTEIVPDERAGRSKYYNIFLNLPQSLAPGQFFIYAWATEGSNQLPQAPFSEGKYVLRMQNYFGNHAVEVFYLVLPNDLTADYEEQPTDTQTVGDYTIYAWEKEVQPDENHVVTVYLSKNESLSPKAEEYAQKLKQPVTVNIRHSPNNDKLSVQYAAIAIAEAAGVPYNWDKSAQLADPQRQNYIEPMNIDGKNATQALTDLLNPVGLAFGVNEDGVYLYDPKKFQETETTKTFNSEPLELSTLPFFAGETMRLKLTTPAGMNIGQMIWQCRSIEQDGVFYDRIESYMHIGVQNFQQYTAVDTQRNSFLPVRGLTKNEMGTFDADYGDNTVTLKTTVNGKETVRNFDVSGAVYDNEQALYVIRALPLEVGYKAEFDIFPVQSGSVARCKVRVTDIQTIPCHAGEMECYAIKLAVYSGGIKALEHDLWISTDERRWLVKYDSGQVVMELMGAGKSDLNQPQRIFELGLNYEFEIPAGWQFIHSASPGQYKISVQLLPPGLTVWAAFSGIEKTGLPDSIKEIAKGDIEILKGFFENYAVRPESWTEQPINGADSTTYIADYEDKGQQMVEYRTYIMADSLVYWFVFRVEKDIFEEEKPVLDSIVKSFNPKAYNRMPSGHATNQK